MSQAINLRSILAGSAVLGAMTFAVFSQATTAEAASGVLACRGNTKSAVVSCCQQEVREHGKPMWMRSAQASCSSLVVCAKSSQGSTAVSHVAAPPKRCSITADWVKFSNSKDHNRDGGKGRGSSSQTHGKP